MAEVKICPYCGANSIESLHSSSAMYTYRCKTCRSTWHHSPVGDRKKGLHQKYVVIKDGVPVDGDSFVLILSDPAARVALRAYALATRNSDLATDLTVLLAQYESSPERYPVRGSEGILNKGVDCWYVEQDGRAVMIIDKE